MSESLIIDREAREIMHLVASVCLSVRLSVCALTAEFNHSIHPIPLICAFYREILLLSMCEPHDHCATARSRRQLMYIASNIIFASDILNTVPQIMVRGNICKINYVHQEKNHSFTYTLYVATDQMINSLDIH